MGHDLRDSPPIRFQCTILAMWPLLFAGVTTLIGNDLTSKQWTYLFSAPGRQWLYITLFAIGGAVTLTGLKLGGECRMMRVLSDKRIPRKWLCPRLVGAVRRRYGITATGLYISGTTCFIIAVFYVSGPLIESGVKTNGWTIWLLGGLWFYSAASTQAPGITLWTQTRAVLRLGLRRRRVHW